MIPRTTCLARSGVWIEWENVVPDFFRKLKVENNKSEQQASLGGKKAKRAKQQAQLLNEWISHSRCHLDGFHTAAPAGKTGPRDIRYCSIFSGGGGNPSNLFGAY